eukprot:CAMPEP_0184711796 /NCGR_PEP_ID=MMETSP0314-20130426/2432_1 /TAXON_ID=38298 /ORGANISM="Rhodella maculata, Strain CCMP 736" /LENGTH=113 /DNA_ID=CAMNT_0027174051 /DNA_START=52 /DNA_END=389 /DNA_ORIENTATION=+
MNVAQRAIFDQFRRQTFKSRRITPPNPPPRPAPNTLFPLRPPLPTSISPAPANATPRRSGNINNTANNIPPNPQHGQQPRLGGAPTCTPFRWSQQELAGSLVGVFGAAEGGGG